MNDEMTQILTNEDFVGMSSSTFRESCEFSSNGSYRKLYYKQGYCKCTNFYWELSYYWR